MSLVGLPGSDTMSPWQGQTCRHEFEPGKAVNMARKEETTKKQTFRVTAPSAMSVILVGDFTHWQSKGIPMRKGPDGVWTATVDLAPGKHTYRFIVDGEWADDPNCTLRVPNPYGSEDMIRQVA
jgi:1,4-alpha-glucan branching enzyme